MKKTNFYLYSLVGDHSSSESERYVLHVHGQGKGTPRIAFQSQQWGRVDTGTFDFYNGTYKVCVFTDACFHCNTAMEFYLLKSVVLSVFPFQAYFV